MWTFAWELVGPVTGAGVPLERPRWSVGRSPAIIPHLAFRLRGSNIRPGAVGRGRNDFDIPADAAFRDASIRVLRWRAQRRSRGDARRNSQALDLRRQPEAAGATT